MVKYFQGYNTLFTARKIDEGEFLMKKFKIVLMSAFMLMLGSFLVACDFKSPEASFTNEELVVSIDENINLDEYLTVKEVEKSSIDYKLENSSLFDVDGRNIIAKQSGKSYVYATYKNNILSSMQIIVKSSFPSPTFSSEPLSDDGILTWEPVFAYYDGELVTPSQYRVEGVCVVYSADDPSVVEEKIEINETTTTNSLQLENYGLYSVTVTALGTGYFDDSAPSVLLEDLAFGYVEPAKDFALSEDGVLSWSGEDGTNFAVKFDGVELAQRQTEMSFDLSSYLASEEAGVHTVRVISYDPNGLLLATESEEISITKYDLPTAQYSYNSTSGGNIEVSVQESVGRYEFEFVSETDQTSEKFVVENAGENILSSFDELETGLYTLKVRALPNITSSNIEGEFFFKSDAFELGKVYKLPTAEIDGAGGNEIDGENFAVNLSSEELPFDVLLNIEGLGTTTLVEGFEKGQTYFNFLMQISNAGVYDISLRQIPTSETNLVGEENVYVLNSSKSNTLNVTKVGTISGEIAHKYNENVSEFTFAKVGNATNYILQIGGGSNYADVPNENYEVEIGEEDVTIKLTAKIEDLFDTISVEGKNIFDFRVIAKTANDTLAINSSKIKQIERLNAPSSAGSGNTESKIYSWTSAEEGVGSFKVELYKIDKDLYESNQDEINIDTSSLSDIGSVTEETQIEIVEVGYYYAKVYSLTADENNYISSADALEEVFYICEQLKVEDVKFGNNGTNYLVSILNSENVDEYEILLNDAPLGRASVTSDERTPFLVAENFDVSGEEYRISVVAHSDDERIYNASTAYEFIVERLPRVVRGDIQLGGLSLVADPIDMTATSFAQDISISAIEGAKGVRIWNGSGTSAGSETETSAKLSIANKSNVELNFRFFGSAMEDEFYVMEANKIYLTGETSTFTFTRLQTPTNLAYYDGKLRLEHTSTTSTSYYVLTLVCVGLNNQAQYITIQLDNTTASISGNVVTIDIEKVIENLTAEQEAIYNQSAEIGFAVFAYADRLDGSVVTFCSNYATTRLDNSSVICVVDKMASTTLSIDYQTSQTDYILSWSAIGTNSAYESETKYSVLLDGSEVGEDVSSLSRSFSVDEFDNSTYYEFSVIAKNPYYIQSDTSNIIRIYKLNSISRLRLFETGELGFDVSSSEQDFVDYVNVTTNSGVENNKTGKISISEDGKISLQVVGLKGVESGENRTTYYIDSVKTEWTLANMSVLKPEDETVSYQNNTISWDAFASTENLQCLRYILMFVDENGNKATYKTTNTSENLTTNTDLYNSISALSGEVSIYVSAYLETTADSVSGDNAYVVDAGQTIYYALNTSLPTEETNNNYYVYSNHATITKYSTPKISDVVFDDGELENAQFSDIEIVFEGNYGASGRFNIYLNDQYLRYEDITASDGKYSFTLTADDYNLKVGAGETLKVGIIALSEENIPSSIGSVNIIRANEIESVEFVQSEAGEFSHKIKIEFSTTDYTSGGVVLKFTYKPTGADEESQYILIPINEVLEGAEYDLGDVINQVVEGNKILANDGTVQLSAFVGNYSYAGEEQGTFYLACPTSTTSQEYQILEAVGEVEKASGGFVISDAINSDETIYVVECNGVLFEVTKTNGQFYFEFPRGGEWTNGQYNLTIYAKQANFLNSVTNEVSFELNRMPSVSNVILSRPNADDLSEITITWNDVAGATGYVFRLYLASDIERENLLYEYVEDRTKSTGSTIVNSCTFVDMFGEGYEKLLQAGQIDVFDLMVDQKLVIDLFVKGTTEDNDSNTFSFNATIKGNAIEIDDIDVNEYGNITFNAVAGETYLYRFVGVDGTVLQNWTKVVADSDNIKIDTDKITAEGGTYYNMEIFVVGGIVESPVSATFDGLTFDSVSFTTYGTGRSFVVGTDIVDLGYIEAENNVDFAFELMTGTYSKLFVGLSEDALMNGQVAGFVPTLVTSGSDNLQEICSYPLSMIFDALNDIGQKVTPSESDIVLYFWAYKEYAPDDLENSYTISHASSCAVRYTSDVDFIEIKKLGEVSDNSKYMEDYANTFALFENNDDSNNTTVGIYVKISSITLDEIALDDEDEESQEGEEELPSDTNEPFETIYFVEKADLLSVDYFLEDGNFVINLTSLFEQGELASLSGKFKIEFAVLSTTNDTGETKFVLSDWLGQANGKEFIFERLKRVEALILSAGNLSWTNEEENAQRYYVYFIEELNDDNSLGDAYVYDTTTVTIYDASSFVGVGNSYYLAVRSVNEDPYVISSQLVFVTSNSIPIKVQKNQINSPLKLENGKLYFELEEGQDFVNYIKSCAETTDAVEQLLEQTFTSPFTFNLTDLVNGTIFARLRFTSLAQGVEGKAQTFDINARDLISSIFDLGELYSTKLDALISNAGSSDAIAKLTAFKTLMEDGNMGVGNYKLLFDDRFESLQTGEYKLDYCLLGNSSTLTSIWYNYENENGENSIYINNEPKVQALKQADANYKAINYYKVLVKKSEIYSQVGGELVSSLAENYVMKIYNDVGEYYSFSITKGVNNYSLYLIGSETDQTVSVYEANENGVQTSGGDYLMFYLNQNNSNSILGRYGDEIPIGTYKMQIFAVGNNYSVSSKSSLFNLVLYGFGSDFQLNNGEFSWTAQRNTKTTVVYKKHTSVGEDLVQVETTAATARYSLDDGGYGLYDYVEFLVVGDVYSNNIFVDSEIYYVPNVYKLANPVLSNTNGLIEINDTQNANFEGLNGCYSDIGLYNYRLYNDVSTSSNFYTFTDQNNAQSSIFYETGTTGLSQTSSYYSYKSTEKDASQFYVASIGSSATFEIEDFMLQTGGSEFYMKNVYCIDSTTGEPIKDSSIGVAVRSNFATLDARMMDEITNVEIVDGVMTWNAVTGRAEDGLTIPTTGDQRVVYRVIIKQYDLSNGESGEVENEYPNVIQHYTLETEFDFARIAEEELVKSAKYMKATIQAFSMNFSEDIPASSSYIELVEGGYAYGNVTYEGSTTFVLMGEGYLINSIERSTSIDEGSLHTENGDLVWTFTTDIQMLPSEVLDNYIFTVVDEDFNEIQGEFVVSEGEAERQVKVTFSEFDGQVEAKVQTLTVYVTRINTLNSVIKSFGQSLEITKLKTIEPSDYVITSDDRDPNVEVLDLSDYFTQNPSNEVTLLVYQTPEKTDTPLSFTFTASRNKLYILGEKDESIGGMTDGFVGKIVVGQDSRTTLVFSVKNVSLANCLFSDLSNDIILQRSTWQDGSITWNGEKQQFEWTYEGYNALGPRQSATQVKVSIKTNKEATLYVDQDLSIEATEGETSIPENTEITIDETYENSSKVTYLGNSYYISNSDFGEVIDVVEETELPAGALYKVVEVISEDQTLIQEENGNLYIIPTSAVVSPVYIIEATYGEGDSQIVRTYTTTNTYFVPTIVGKVGITIKIKLGESNIQSDAIAYNDGEMVDFNLFDGGQGTAQSPYLISTEEQFKNISYRLSKESYLTQYSENGNMRTEEGKYYFALQGNITLTENLHGILFEGVFTGQIDGNDFTLEYVNNGVSQLKNGAVTISEGNVVSTSDTSSTAISYGAAVFETFSSSAVVQNLNLKVTLKTPLPEDPSGTTSTVYITRNSLISGLVITNSGRIENVNLTSFSSDFVGLASRTSRVMMIYSGIASINTGVNATITNCSMNANMTISDYNIAQFIFVGGIAFTNYATIDRCYAGDDSSVKSINVIGQNESDVVQVAGIVVTNASYSTLQNCINYANLTVSAQNENADFVAYIAGVTDYASGTVQYNQNLGAISASNILENKLHKGDVYVGDSDN